MLDVRAMKNISPSHPQADPAARDPVSDRAPSCARRSGGGDTDLAQEDLVQEQIRMLQDMARLGMEFAGTIQRQAADRAAREREDGVERGDLADAFARVTRSVRQCIALAAKIDQGRQSVRPKRRSRRTRLRFAPATSISTSRRKPSRTPSKRRPLRMLL